ncbi:hypothetical protein GF325_10340 [Candidatus Bathyarchaeota archaeon]|nr:hypothetical protein [Candidatus Bathyarchaeota archaeon]
MQAPLNGTHENPQSLHNIFYIWTCCRPPVPYRPGITRFHEAYRDIQSTMVDSTSSPDLILYTSDNCAPCLIMKKSIERLKSEMALNVQEVNLSERNVQAPADIRMAPVLRIMKNDQKIVGAVKIIDLRNILLRQVFKQC